MVLTVSEEKNILNSIKNGNPAKKSVLVNENIKLVYKCAQRYDKKYFFDIVQEGCIGLMHAVDKYEFDHGTRFSTYATFWISQAIDRGYQKHKRCMRIPSNILEDLSKLKRATNSFISDNHITPSIADLSQMTGIPCKKIEHYKQLDQETVPLDALINDEDSFIEYLQDESSLYFQEQLERENLKKDLEEALSLLSVREKTVINMHFGLQGQKTKTLAEISRIFNLSRERVRQIKEKALKKIKESIYCPVLKLHLN